MLIYNADAKNWLSGKISRSPLKHGCVPGLNCYSCPGAIASCPLGALQNSLANGRVPFFVAGFLMLTGTLLGRAVCGFLCPAGFVQELLYKIPVRKFPRSLKSQQVSKKARYIKYILLALLCCLFPLVLFLRSGIGSPLFCSWFCPAGTIGAGIPLVIANESLRSAAHALFAWKTAVALILVIWSVVVFRPFCRFFCPLGAIYSFFNRFALFGIHVDAAKCTHCGACVKNCKMGAAEVNDHECIRCGECISSCPFDALH